MLEDLEYRQIGQTTPLFTILPKEEVRDDSLAQPQEESPIDFRVALICMPFYGTETPSIQLGLLGAIARKAGFVTDSYHLNLELAARIPDIYDRLCHHRGHMTGEWLFSVAAFGDEMASDELYFQEFPDECSWIEEQGSSTEYLKSLRHHVLPQFIDECLEAVRWERYRVVGFSSTFQQNVASLALARRIKHAFPSIMIVFGGSNMEDGMGVEYMRRFSFIDFVVRGEGDLVFPRLLAALARTGSEVSDLAGVIQRGHAGITVFGEGPRISNLDSLPIPIYDDYFNRFRTLNLASNNKTAAALPFESSRGCWWGQKHHCTFCGLNGNGMAFRAKDAKRVLAELAKLAETYRVTRFHATDNIMDMKYVTTLFAEIEHERLDYRLFYEAKANLTRQQLQQMYRGGVRWLQPGIESMNTRILALMRKGCSTLQNVRLLKWCRYYGIGVSWNLIWGFPGESMEDYDSQLRVLRQISHLEPPLGAGRIWIERFAPLFVDEQNFSIQGLRPERSYAFVYPTEVDCKEIAYFFEGTLSETLPDEVHHLTQEWVASWRRQWTKAAAREQLNFRYTPEVLLINDRRSCAIESEQVFRGIAAKIYFCCVDTMQGVSAIRREVSKAGYHSASETEIMDILIEFCRRGLMLSEGDQFLALALPSNPNW